MNDTEFALRLLFKRFLLSLPRSLFAPFLLVPPAYIVAGPLSLLVSRHAGSLFNPKSVSRKIHLNFSIPEARIIQGKYEEALDLLQIMICRDPARLEVYMRIMNLAVYKMKQTEIAKNAFQEGLKNMKDLRKRKILADEYRRLMTIYRDTVTGFEWCVGPDNDTDWMAASLWAESGGKPWKQSIRSSQREQVI